ncbi:asparaginase [Aggregatimonas sangjinii]|uniref:Asparaginase n=1 Tax=Aggregatimonas sangjinii TaxID=2583587 RepID=A0A5B7SZ54_9FLAO|nr:asparaginase [Aggregatimonas sangjinii]
MIWIITTGGTIEGLEYNNESEKNEATVSIESLLQEINVSFEYCIDCAFSKDSRFITPDDRALLNEKINAISSNHVLITHGTITMVETATYLGKLDINKTIVLVGSFVPGTEKNSDASFNLGYAICALQTLEKGVYIAMNGNVFSWDKVRKNVAKNRFECSS